MKKDKYITRNDAITEIVSYLHKAEDITLECILEHLIYKVTGDDRYEYNIEEKGECDA